MTRTIARLTPMADPVSASFAYASDYLGRLESVTYPDGEQVAYGYDSGGQIKTVTGTHWGRTTEYVKDIAYDPFGQRTYIEYGNGVRTSYAYDENRRWLDTIDTSSSWGSVYQAMDYRFDLVGNVLGYTNESAGYSTSQTYGYDDLYQLTSASGTTVNKQYGMTEYSSTYQQTYAFDIVGNLTKKTSSNTVSPKKTIGADLNYTLGYTYYAGKSHQAEIIGDIYYRYDANGNVTETRKGGHGAGAVPSGEVYRDGDVRYTDHGFALVRNTSGGGTENVWSRYYQWNEENRLKRSVEGDLTVDYRYGADGERAVKYSKRSETLYFDSMWQAMTDYPSLRQSKHVYVGKVRVATRLNIAGAADVGYEETNTYYYHPDHVGSAQLVTDAEGEEYERMEYTPYGELWVEKTSDGFAKIPFRFTGKELDDETGLYYYGARYLDPRTSTWLSADPALGEYIPSAPVDEEARKKNGNLPGMGGVYNLVNLHLYHYAGNNPVKYTDPDGKSPVIGEYNGVVVLSHGGKANLQITVQRGAGNANFNDTFKVFSDGKLIFSQTVHAEKFMKSNDPIDFTLPAGDYSATLSSTAGSFDPALRLKSDSVKNPVTGKPGIPISYGFLVHPNEITRETKREERTAQGKSNGPFNSPQSLGCIIFRNEEEFNQMWSVLTESGFVLGDTLPLEIIDAK